MSERIAAIAIAKDEAAYIHEWVHHHLYFGFSPILVGVNRTTDQTVKVLEHIKSHHPEVLWFDVNWIDQTVTSSGGFNPTMQETAYSFLIDQLKDSYPDVGYALCVDVDEFWCPENFEGHIQGWLDDAPAFDVASFHWALQVGDPETFAPPFKSKRARLRREVKSLLNVHSAHMVKEMRPHTPILHGDAVHIDGNGNLFTPRFGQRSQTRPDLPQKAFIFHRLIRSELEYRAGLRKGRLGHNVPIKSNREGFYMTHDKYQLSIDAAALNHYHTALARFVDECGLADLLTAAREALAAKADAVLELPRADIFKYLHHLFVALRGTQGRKKLADLLAGFLPYSGEEQECVRACIDHLEEHQPKMRPAIELLNSLIE